MTQARARKALETALNSWATAQGISVAWENVEFTPTTSSFARFYMLPAQTGSGFLEGTHRSLRGVAQVSIYTPIGAGPGAADTLVDSLDSYFSPESPLSADSLDLFITAPMSAAPALENPGWRVVPVSCEYRADYIVTTLVVATYLVDGSGNRLTDASGNYLTA